MKKILKYIWYPTIFLYASCTSWLNVEPFDRVSEEQLYEKADGFYNQLNGIYKNMASKELYGRELSWGAIDIIAQYYNLESFYKGGYSNLNDLEYEETRSRPYFNAFWEKGYNVIANCNNLIANVTKADSNLFEYKEKERKCIEGEAKALRAMMHFDLLRMFAPVGHMDGKYIPYVSVFPTHIPVKMKTSDVLENIREDLIEAHKLTADFDTLRKGMIFRLDERLELSNGSKRNVAFRGYRLNHYAIKALLARFELYAGNKEEASKWALDLMEYKDNFRFTNEYHIERKHNIKLYGDVLFAFYNNNAVLYESEINTGDYYLNLDPDRYTKLFGEDKDDDYRCLQWMDFDGCYIPLKYKKADVRETGGKISNIMIPMLRLSEMYYILAECAYAAGDVVKAKEWLNTVRKARGCRSELPDVANKDGFNQLILQDFRREFYGEGQLFFFYKRLGLDAIIDDSNTKQYGEKFVFPIPESNDI